MATRAALVALPLLAVTAAGAAWRRGADRAAATARIEARQDAALQRIELAAAASLGPCGADALYLATSPLVRRWADRDDDDTRDAVTQDLIAFARVRGRYDQVRLLDPDGRTVVRVDAAAAGPVVVAAAAVRDEHARPYAAAVRTLPAGDVYVSRLDLDVEHGAIVQPPRPVLRLGAAVFDSGGARRGTVLIDALGAPLLDRLRQTSVAEPGQYWLVDDAGYWMLGPDPADEWGFVDPARAGVTVAARYPTLWSRLAAADGAPVRISIGAGEVAVTTVAPGELVIRDVAPAAGAHAAAAPARWHLIAFLPRAELDARVAAQTAPWWAIWTVSAGLIGIVTWLGSSLSLRRARARRAEAEAAAAIGALNDDLERRNAELARRTAELQASNQELEAFSYSVSHDLRAPLRAIDGLSQVLVDKHADGLGDVARGYLQRVRAAAQRMGLLIDDLLLLARSSRAELRPTTVDVTAMARAIAADLQATAPDRDVTWAIGDDLVADADPALLQVVLHNLLGNAWKYTSRRPRATIVVEAGDADDAATFVVRDDGAGFDMAYADKLFEPFERLHGQDEFAGNGVGLALVQRIVERHGGRIWAEGVVDRGATFTFTLGASPPPTRRHLPREAAA
ncbi:MAG: hypothetical protein H6709_04005 [Kofleriaceae bacterium]|nr:hypothetical protein [Kofleriaceae bacterium]